MGICGSKEGHSSTSASSSPRQSRVTNSSLSQRTAGAAAATTAATTKSGGTSLSNENSASLPMKNDIADSSKESNPDRSRTKLQTVIENNELTTNSDESGTKKSSKPTKHAKILLLGSGESGKSTILKQIKIIHQNGFSESEKLEYKPFVFQNIVQSAQCLIRALKEYNLVGEMVNISSDEMDYILNYEVPLNDDESVNHQLDDKVADIVERLIDDETTKKIMKSSEYDFYILDSAPYFFENLPRIRAADYLPSVTDIVRTRKQTSGIFDTKFQMEDLDVHLFDVGGQRSERKKWIHCFDNVTAIIFCVALSEYDQTLLEAPTKNRLEESLNLFESVVNSMWFKRTAVILCLNKIDLFIEKLPNSPMEKYFPDYVGGPNVNKAVKYILWRFKQLNRANLNLVPYVSQATDTNNIRLAFAVVKETVLHNNLLDSGIIT
jgi:guanine nucleotide-binding protein G(i) subunit alpha